MNEIVIFNTFIVLSVIELIGISLFLLLRSVGVYKSVDNTEDSYEKEYILRKELMNLYLNFVVLLIISTLISLFSCILLVIY